MEKEFTEVYCGGGKGKTTLAIGQCLRASAQGKSVIIIQFLKGRERRELDFLEELDLDGKDFVTGFTQFKVLDSVKAVKNADGKYEVEFSVPSITDDMENIQLVCYNEETKEWTIVDPINVDKEKKTIKVALDDLCYFTIVADAKEDTAE